MSPYPSCHRPSSRDGILVESDMRGEGSSCAALVDCSSVIQAALKSRPRGDVGGDLCPRDSGGVEEAFLFHRAGDSQFWRGVESDASSGRPEGFGGGCLVQNARASQRSRAVEEGATPSALLRAVEAFPIQNVKSGPDTGCRPAIGPEVQRAGSVEDRSHPMVPGGMSGRPKSRWARRSMDFVSRCTRAGHAHRVRRGRKAPRDAR